MPPSALPRIRVLVADDSAPFLEACGRILAGLPQVEVVGTAPDGEQAVSFAAGTRLDLVFMDLQMPRLNGLQATQQIRAGLPGIYVIMITLHDSEELKAASIAAGADRFISKHDLRAALPGVIAQLFPDRFGAGPEPR